MADYDDLPTFVIETRGGGAGTFMLGVLVGAAAALLLAPRSGMETQAEIAGAVRRAREGVGDRVSGARERVSETLDSVRGGVGTRVQQARAALDAGVDAARDAREELQRRVDEAKRAYRSTLGRGEGSGGGDGAAEGNGARGGEVVVVAVTTEESSGDLA
ncbi:MAG TPA: YtxH domain-containing protein [Longimicrobium sp.]|nr:YtxH domain-containing protein [Longimicrobium sp.]